MKITDQTDAATIRKFANSYKGKVIEFDGCVAFMMQHGNYKTRFDVCLAGEIKGYNTEGGYIILEPVFMKAR